VESVDFNWPDPTETVSAAELSGEKAERNPQGNFSKWN
jgi:hypothetical protein